MGTRITAAFLIFVMGLSKLTLGQESQKLPNNELREIVELALDLPDLQPYYHVNTNPERVPVKINEFGEINSTNLSGVEKFGAEILVLKNEEIKQKKIPDCFNIINWILAENNLSLQLEYPIEGIVVNIVFERKDSNWKIISSDLREK